MSAFHIRRDEDVAKLKELEKRTAGRIQVTKVSGNPISTIGLKLLVRTAEDSKYPLNALNEVEAMMQLSSRYPFEEPTVSISTKVFNPNVYTSGRVCLGSKWISTEYLDLLAQRLFKILSFDETIVNTSSAANGDAARWYIRAKSEYPSHFPSDTLSAIDTKATSSIKWTEKAQSVQSTATVDRAVVACPKCHTKLRLPAGKSGEVSCPSCKHAFSAST